MEKNTSFVLDLFLAHTLHIPLKEQHIVLKHQLISAILILKCVYKNKQACRVNY